MGTSSILTGRFGIGWDGYLLGFPNLSDLCCLETPQKKEIYFLFASESDLKKVRGLKIRNIFLGQIRVWTLRWASFPVTQADFQANPEK